MIDPLFQRTLVQECKKRKIPVIFDQVFVGCYRIGPSSVTSLLHCTPDITCYAKALTGGVVPMAAILATKEIFNKFKGNIADSLLHGHSYTAYPVGCNVAYEAMQFYKQCANYNPETKSFINLWDVDLVNELSSLDKVTRVVSIGSVLAVELAAEKGYTSSLNAFDVFKSQNISIRSLGNVLYFMGSHTTGCKEAKNLLEKILKTIKTTKF